MMEDQNLEKETECKETQKVEISEIEKLTDDCLIEIFQRLTTIADKIRIERVCKRWQRASQRSWNNFQSIDSSAKTWGIEKYRYDQRLIRSTNFDKIIRLSGRYLTNISTGVSNFAKLCHLLSKIVGLQLFDDCFDGNVKYHEKYSSLLSNQQDIQEMTSQCTYDTWQKVLSWLISEGQNITNFKIELTHRHYKEEDFASLLGKLKKLKSFALYNYVCPNWSCTFLLELPFEIIQEIILTNTYTQPIDVNVLSAIIQKCKKLQTLGINVARYLEPGILALLPLHAASLKNLKLQLGDTWSSQWQSVLLSTMAALTQLEKLDVSYCYTINDEFLEEVAKNCKKLTYLNLCACAKVTDRGISSICKLEKLTYLNIGDLPGIRNPLLEKLTSLVVLVSYFNQDLQKERLCTFLKKSHQLRALSLSYFHLHSNKILNVAIEVAHVRNSNNVLDLYVDNKTKIDMSVLDKKTPFLNIIDCGSKRVPLSKYGIEDPFNIEEPEVYIY